MANVKLGQIVFYREQFTIAEGVVTMPAIVTKIEGDRVSLITFQPNGATNPKNQVEFTDKKERSKWSETPD